MPPHRLVTISLLTCSSTSPAIFILEAYLFFPTLEHRNFPTSLSILLQELPPFILCTRTPKLPKTFHQDVQPPIPSKSPAQTFHPQKKSGERAEADVQFISLWRNRHQTFQDQKILHHGNSSASRPKPPNRHEDEGEGWRRREGGADGPATRVCCIFYVAPPHEEGRREREDGG